MAVWTRKDTARENPGHVSSPLVMRCFFVRKDAGPWPDKSGFVGRRHTEKGPNVAMQHSGLLTGHAGSMGRMGNSVETERRTEVEALGESPQLQRLERCTLPAGSVSRHAAFGSFSMKSAGRDMTHSAVARASASMAEDATTEAPGSAAQRPVTGLMR